MPYPVLNSNGEVESFDLMKEYRSLRESEKQNGAGKRPYRA